MPSHLERMVSEVRRELAERKAAAAFASVAAEAGRRGAGRRMIIRAGEGPGIIAEIKRASPSKGWIRRDLDAAETAAAYVRGGACAVSVLTEGKFFGGSLADLSAASAACGSVPVLRKDFILDEYMVAESRAHGADLVLLMVAVLGRGTERMLEAVRGYGMEALVEVHDESEMAIAADSGASMIGINNRNLATLRVDLETSVRLLPLSPQGATKVVESGISSPVEVRRLHAMGADAFLVGESLARAADKEKAVRDLREYPAGIRH